MENIDYLKVFETSNTISEVLKKIGKSDNSKNWKQIKEKAKEIGFDLDIYKKRKIKYCKQCGKELKRGQTKFCSRSCAGTFNNTGKKLANETKEKIRKTLTNKKESIKKQPQIKIKEIRYCKECGKVLKGYQTQFCSRGCSSRHIGKQKHLENYKYYLEHQEEFNRANYMPRLYKDFIFEEQDYKCAVCGCDDVWNGKKIIFVLDHINGDSSDNRRENLRLVCPNCDSQLPTFKSKNKNSQRRKYYRDKTKKGEEANLVEAMV